MTNKIYLASIVDRIIYGNEHTIDRHDAYKLDELIPKQSLLSLLLHTLPFGFEFKGSMPGGSVQGATPGGGNTSLREDGKEVNFNSTGSESIRAGQWEIRRISSLLNKLFGKEVIEIRQVMTTLADTNTMVRIDYKKGTPSKTWILAPVMGGASFQAAMYQTWKHIV